MDELKKIVGGFTPQLAAIINACFAGLFLIFFLVLPALSTHGSGVNGAKLIEHAPFFFVLVWLVIVLLPVAAAVVPFIKNKICPCCPVVLAIVYITAMFTLTAIGGGFVGINLGIGAILNIIIVLLPWICFAKLRGDKCCCGDSSCDAPKLPGQK